MPDLPVAHRARRGYLDWLRGLAVLIMIEGHLLDSWTRTPDRDLPAFGWAIVLGGFGSALFLLLAGVSVGLSAGSKLRRTGDARWAARAVMRRGLEILGLAFLFRVQAWLLGSGEARTLLRVDILNVMGPSIVAAAALWAAVSSTRGRIVVLGATTFALVTLTPVIRSLPALASLPDPLEAYIHPIPGFSNFVFFPWSGFVFAGALAGVLLDEARTRDRERRLNAGMAAAGALLAVLCWLAASLLPSPFGPSSFWTTSPAFFGMRTGLLLVAIALAFAWESRPGSPSWSPLRQLGRTSLFIYWIHVEMIYGRISRPLHQVLSLEQAALAFMLFTMLMLACSLGKDRVVQLWRGRAAGSTPGMAPHFNR